MSTRPEPYLRFWNSDTFGAIDRLAEAAVELGVSTAGLALAWLYNHPDVTSSIVGPRRVGHFDPIEEAIGLDLTEADWREIGGHFTSVPR
jgi:aryl-alcohol dehydrogenase (NADP+)